MASSQIGQVHENNMYKAFFDDATLSDLTIHLSDRAVRVHRIVLCRQSEYFTKLLTGQFQESGAKDVVLHEDDPESMVALLRYIYGLSYDESFGEGLEQLQRHAEAYVVADRYQVQGLELTVSNNMQRISTTRVEDRVSHEEPELDDFINALRIIVTGTPADDKLAWRVMLEGCILNLQHLHQRPDFLKLARESADLGAELVGHLDLECGLAGDWVCPGACRGPVTVVCVSCWASFEGRIAMENRDMKDWFCAQCRKEGPPNCMSCSEPVKWERRGF